MSRALILVVDDEPGITAFMGACLRQQGYEVVEASDGEQALQAMERILPALIILDILMPKLDGFEVCRRIREWSQVPIIMMSGSATAEDRTESIRLGADDFLHKPFNIDELITRVEALLPYPPVVE